MANLNGLRRVLSGQLVGVVVGTIALGLSGCNTTTTPPEAATPESEVTTPSDNSEETLRVVTTFLPMTQFTTAVAGDRAIVTQLLPTNVGPHDYQAKPSDAQAITEADVLVKNGLEMEVFLDDTIENAANPDLLIIDSSEGVPTLTTEDHAEEHAEPDHNKTKGEDHASTEHGHDHGEFNPHIWLDPKRAIQQVENIRDGLIAADPEGKSEYTANAAAFIADLTTLDAEITAQLAPFLGQTFVVFHDFAPYFAESYGLNAEILVGIPEENPSPEAVKQVMETVQAEGLSTIMTEPQAGQESFTSIANDLNIRVSVFDPGETGAPDAINPDYYLKIMRQNTKNLVASFETPNQARSPVWLPNFATIAPEQFWLQDVSRW
ncbi:MAG: ABC transporter substrate-binding protein [Oscillatoriales cyanobacterium]|nr:MAG: ABC transporter substrate-binding protein [Oscillatoriales cyanobacterium]